MSSRFSRARTLQPTPSICKPPPPAWRMIPAVPLLGLYGKIYWEGQHGTPILPPWSFYDYYDRFNMVYHAPRDLWTAYVEHGTDNFYLSVHAIPPGHPGMITCRFSTRGNPPRWDSWTVNLKVTDPFWYTHKSLYDRLGSPYTRIYTLNH